MKDESEAPDASEAPRATWLAFALLLAMASPALAGVDLPCPLCEGAEPLSIGALVDLALTTMIRKGLSFLLLGALVVVGLPWAIAGAAVTLVHLPRRLGR